MNRPSMALSDYQTNIIEWKKGAFLVTETIDGFVAKHPTANR
jgi:hypothetical protein